MNRIAVARQSLAFIQHPESPGRNSPDSGVGIDGYILGSQNIYTMLGSKSVPSEFYLDCTMGHGIKSTADSFGVASVTSIADIYNYIVQRAATFFQAVETNKAGLLITTKFVDCENKRNKCSTADNNNGCSNSQTCP